MVKRQAIVKDGSLPSARANAVAGLTKKRRTRGLNDASDNTTAYHDSSSLGPPMPKQTWDHEPLDDGELAAFQSWVKKSDRPPVPMAGAAKRIPDEGLPMFRESRVASSIPLALPGAGVPSRHVSEGASAATVTAARRPKSWGSERSNRTVMRSVERLVEEKLSSTTEILLPPLASLPWKDAQIREAMLSEIKSTAARILSNLKDCDREVVHDNQHSGRPMSAPIDGKTTDIIIPHDVFYEPNSFLPLAVIGLRDWTEFCTSADSAIAVQIAESLSATCIDLDLSGLSNFNTSNGLANMLRSCPCLERLSLSRFEDIPKPAFHRLARNCEVLQELNVSNSDTVTDDMLNSITVAFSKLSALDLSGCARITDAGVALLSKKLPRLERLRLDDCPYVSDVSLLQIIKAKGTRLKTLSLRRCPNVSDATVKELLASLPRALEELNLSSCIEVTDDAMEFLVSVPSYYGTKRITAYTALAKLDVSGCSSITPLGFSWIAAACPLLIHLNVAGCVNMCDKSVRALSSLERLEGFDMSRCPRVSDTGMAAFFNFNTTSSEKAQRRRLQQLAFAYCNGVGEKTVSTLADACFGSLTSLDLRFVASIPPSTIIKLVRLCRSLTCLLINGQSGVTRAVLANLASCNKVLQVLDLSECGAVDDLALFPLLVMDSIEALRLNRCSKITIHGLRSLPRRLKRLEMCELSNLTLDDRGCCALADHFPNLEELNISKCPGATVPGLAHLMKACAFLHQLNLADCGCHIQPAHLGSLLDTKRRDIYKCEIVVDDDAGFMGIASVDPEASTRARRREMMAAQIAQRHYAATWIQTRYRLIRKQQEKRKRQETSDWDSFCAAIDIQRVFRGYQCRKLYGTIQREVTKIVVFLQYKWRKKLQERRVRRAVGYWTNRHVLKNFMLWKTSHETLKADRENAKKEAKASRALCFWSAKILPRVFEAWRTHALSKRQKARKSLGFWKCWSQPRVFAVWQQLVDATRRRRLRLTHVFLNIVDVEALNSSAQLIRVAKANARAKRVIWRLWKEFMVAQKQFVLQASLSILTGNLVPWAFREWRKRVQLERRVRMKNAALLGRIFHREKARVWVAWRDFVHDQQAKKRAAARFFITTRTKCFLRWQQWHCELLALRAVSTRVANRLRMTQAHRAVCDWYEFTLERRANKNAQRRALMFLTNGTLVRVFSAWAAYTERANTFRRRLKALMENANLTFTFTTWVWYTRHAQHHHAMATRIQAFWRGVYTRRRCENRFLYRTWAAVLIQIAWRGRLARALLRAATRKARLREYLRAERERDTLAAEEAQTREFNRALDMVILIQQRWRGVAARSLFVEIRRDRYIRRKQEEAELQELARVEARRRQLERIQREKLRQSAATEIQRHVRGWLARREFVQQRELLHAIRCAVRVQAVYRGRISRRRTAALRRSYITRMEVLTRRAVEGKVLRALGAKARPTQRGLRGFLSFFGLDPATFLTDVKDVFREVREDFETLTAFVSVVRAKVQANAALVSSKEVQQGGKSLERQPSLMIRALNRARMAKQHLDNVDRMVDAASVEQQREDETIRAGDAVRIVLRGHPRCGETAFVLGVHDSIAQVKLDVDGALEFLPIAIPATKTEPARLVMHKVPGLAFSGIYGDYSRGGRLTTAWRDALEVYAASIADESKRYCASRVIQCAVRVYLARIRYQQELEAQGINAARRQEALLHVLATFGCANTRIASLLVQLRLVRPLNIPPGLPDEPLAVQKVIDRCVKWIARKQELNSALLTLTPIAIPNSPKSHGEHTSTVMLPVPFTRLLDRLVFYPLQWLQRATSVPVARRLERQGLAEMAAFIGGAEFAKTFEQRHTQAREHFFLQLAGCRFCASEGWALVHGVFQKRKIVTQHPSLWNETRSGKKATTTKLVPHGWGVAHLLTGRVKGKRSRVNWLERNSIEAQFKSLQMVRAMKQQESAERLEAQILSRQGAWNVLRAAEGARGFAKRHTELSKLEEKSKAFFARFERERSLRDKEESNMFGEEAQTNKQIEREKRELVRQGRQLSELQQQVPEPVVEIELVASRKTALEFLVVGCTLEVEFDDEAWYECRVLSLDVYDTQTAEVEYHVDQKRERIKLIETRDAEAEMNGGDTADDNDAETQKKRLLPIAKSKLSVAELTAAAAVKKAAKDVPFRRWRAGKAVDVVWEPPPDNGSLITQYILEWKREEVEGLPETTTTSENGDEKSASTADPTSGKSIIASIPGGDDDDDNDADVSDDTDDGDDKHPQHETESMDAPISAERQLRRRRRPTPPTKTTIWPIAAESESSLRIRVAAENARGVGLASVYVTLDAEVLVDVSHETAVPLSHPPPDTSRAESRERRSMAGEDKASLEYQRYLTCEICLVTLGSEPAVHEHICRNHAVPLICPFRSCTQVCASERALRYHIWRCTVPSPTPEESANELFMEIFDISRQYSLRKPRRHILPAQSALRRSESSKNLLEGGDQDEEEFLESKYQEAVAAWIATGARMHSKLLARAEKMRQRERENRYEPPKSLFGVDFSSPELNVARRNAVLNTIAMLREDLESFRVETNTQLDAWGNEERELQEYIALKTKRIKASDEEWQKQSLKRERKKAEKSLSQVQQQIAALVASSTIKIDAMTAELARLERIEQAFVPFIHHVVRLLRLGAVIDETHEKCNSILKQHQIILDHFQEDLRKLMVRMHSEVETLEAWDAMIVARRRQLEALEGKLFRLQRQHAAEMQRYKQQRDAGDELFELGKLRQQQSSVVHAREIADRELLSNAKRTVVEAAGAAERAEKAAKELAELAGGSDLQVGLASLKIANHDLQLHGKFLRGKSADAAYLADGDVDRGGGDTNSTELAPKPSRGGDGARQDAASAGSPSTLPAGQSTTEEAPPTGSLPAPIATNGPTSSSVKLHSNDVPHTWLRIECEFQDGRIAGAVRVEFNDGSVYEGPWVEDAETYDKPCDVEPLKTRFSANHWGKFTTRDGAVWQGEEVDNFFSPFTATGPHFEVALAPPLRHKYSGAVRAGQFHGFGVLQLVMTVTRGEYVGEWREGKRHGYGIEKFDSGEIYEGYWAFDRYHGDGELVYDDGSRYVGAFSRGMWHGSGVRTLANGDQIVGDFHDGFLDGHGMVEFSDKRHYHGEFKRTRRHGLGALTFPNGDRYEGPFENDEPHGDGKFYSRASSTGELLVRNGRWVRGERVAWLSHPSSQVATATFLAYFATQRKVEGEVEMDLRISQFHTPYAVMVARMLPHLPEGVDADDPFVKSVVAQLAKTQSVVVGADVLTKTQQQYAKVVADRSAAEGPPLEKLHNQVDACEMEHRARTREVAELSESLSEKTEQEEAMQVKIEIFWKRDSGVQTGEDNGAEVAYRRAVERLRNVPLDDWYKLRTACFGSQQLDATYMSLLEAFASLLSFTSNRYLSGSKPTAPSREEIARLLSNSDENVLLGDKEGLIHRYSVKALYVLPLFDAYSFAEGPRREMLLALTPIVHHPRLRTSNVKLYQISPALAAVCAWVHVAFRYARRAMEIAPVVGRALKQLVVVDHARKSLGDAQTELAAATTRMGEARMLLKEHNDRLENLRRQERELRRVLDDIDALDRAQHAPLVKNSIKRPPTARPASAAPVSATSDAGDAATTTIDVESSSVLTTVNRRQVFGNAASSEGEARVQKEDVLASILSDEERAADFAVLKKEVCKVLDKHGSPVPLEDFPAQFEKWLLKPLVPSAFGVKKLRTLLLMLDDVCFIAEPTKPGDSETVRLRPPPLSDEEEEDVGESGGDDQDAVIITAGLSRGPPPPRLGCYCRVCPGVSYATPAELRVHETTKWHYWNSERRRVRAKPLKWTLAATFWSEVYDGQSGEVCFYNKMTGAVVGASDGPPLEMQANDVMLELLSDSLGGRDDGGDKREQSLAAVEEDGNELGGGMPSPWEEVADDAGNVYFYNRETGASSWTLPDAASADAAERSES